MKAREDALQERYQFVAEIGKGGMSTVYLVKDLNLESYWAIKQVKSNSSIEFDAFKKEVELLASLNHSDIPRIVDRIEIGDDYYVVMDFIDGTSLAKIINIEGPQEEKKVIDWGIQLCGVLEYLHTARKNPIIYRDMKPENIMLTPSGGIKLIDFGIARECKRGQRIQGEALGTKGYAAPEQYRGADNKLDERTDIYALGATMFFLSTGITPGRPPRGVPAVRAVAPDVSDGFEYVVAKCTADAPENRYSNVAELRVDLENIERLSSIYRTKMKQRVAAFWLSLILSFTFAIVGFVGYQLNERDLSSRYRTAFQAAVASERSGDYVGAATQYSQAIEARPNDRETYVLWFEALLPRGGENMQQETMAAIDGMRKSYLENPQSAMYRDPTLALLVTRRCIEVGTVPYARYALEYISIIKDSKEYQQGDVHREEVQSYEVLASFLAQEAASLDFSALEKSMLELETFTDTGKLQINERLSNYYILIQVYSTYPMNLPKAYEKVYEIGGKAQEILQNNADNENMTFNNVIPMYELVAASQYNSAALYTTDREKEQAYRNSIEWFGYLRRLRVELPESLALKEANAYKGVFNVYNTPQSRSRMTEEVLQNLEHAIGLYEQIIQNNSSSFLAHLNLSQSLLDRELLKPATERNMDAFYQAYMRTRIIANNSNDLPIAALMQYEALGKQMQSLGLEV